MPARRPHHRSIWHGSDHASRAFHLARLTAAVRVLVRLVQALLHRSPGLYAVSPALVLEARTACEDVAPYLEHEIEEPQE